MSSYRLLDGSVINLGKKLGDGGEGAVYAHASDPNLVVKIYHHPVKPAKVEKLQVMASLASPEILKIAAWPTAVVGNTSAVVGLTMPRVSGASEAHQLYNPQQRKAEHPEADWRFLVQAARNAAAAVKTVHAAGHVIGDVNQKGFLVARDATVRLIDCDSFQIVHGGRQFLCDVGVAEFTPPELHGAKLSAAVRSPNHDAFGLAVLIFHFLFVGRHPFAGIYQAGEMPIEKAIQEFRFAYSRNAAVMRMLAPPHTLSLSAAGFEVAALFERAFSKAASGGGRPSAAEWVAALDKLVSQSKRCSVDPTHWHLSSLPQCPWCEIERLGGPAFFIATVAQLNRQTAQTLDLTALWREIEHFSKAPALQFSPMVASSQAPAAQPGAAATGYMLGVGFITASIVLFGAGLLNFMSFGAAALLATLGAIVGNQMRLSSELAKHIDDAASRASRMRTDYDAIVANAQRQYDKGVDSLRQLRIELERQRTQLQLLPQGHKREIDQLKATVETSQLRAFLNRRYIRTAAIDGIGESLKTALLNYNIETAADIDQRIYSVPGIGAARGLALEAWRDSVKSKFRFNPSQGIAPADIQAVDHKYNRLRVEAENRLRVGKSNLESTFKKSIHLSSSAQQQSNVLVASAAGALAEERELTDRRADIRVKASSVGFAAALLVMLLVNSVLGRPAARMGDQPASASVVFPSQPVPLQPSASAEIALQSNLPAQVRIRRDIADANFFATGTTPFNAQGLTAGKYVAVFSSDLAPNVTRRFEIRQGMLNPPVRAVFDTLGSISVGLTSGWGLVLVDGQERGETPIEVSSLRVGLRSVDVVLESGDTLTRSVTVRARQTSRVTFDVP